MTESRVDMNEFRCSNCNRLLGMIEGKAEIQCSRCKMKNIIDLTDEMINDGHFDSKEVLNIIIKESH